MPTFAYVELPVLNAIDRRRQRVAVRVRPASGGASVFLGDVWCSPATGRWHFTTGPRYQRRGDTSAGFRSRDDAAQALFDTRIAAADAQVHTAVADANALREAAAEPLLSVTFAPDRRGAPRSR